MAEDLDAPAGWSRLARQHPILATVPGPLRSASSQQEFAVGDVLFRRGARPGGVLFVVTGELRLVRHTAEGQQIILQRSRGGFLAEASLESKTYHCDILAAEDGNLVFFPILDFRQALEDSHEFRQVWMSRLAGEVRRLRAQNERLHLNKAVDRVVHYLESEGKEGKVRLTQSRKAWAAELGLSHEALYRTLARMEASGSISVQGEEIRLRHHL